MLLCRLYLSCQIMFHLENWEQEVWSLFSATLLNPNSSQPPSVLQVMSWWQEAQSMGYDHRRGQDVMHRLSRFMGDVLNNFLCSNVFHHFSTHADVMSGFRCESQLMIMWRSGCNCSCVTIYDSNSWSVSVTYVWFLESRIKKCKTESEWKHEGQRTFPPD